MSWDDDGVILEQITHEFSQFRSLNIDEAKVVAEVRRMIDEAAITFDRRLERLRVEFEHKVDCEFSRASREMKKSIEDVLARQFIPETDKKRLLDFIWNFENDD